MGANGSIPAVYDAPAYAILTLDIVLTTGAVVGRIVSRKWMKAELATDDYFTYAAYVGSLIAHWRRTLFAKTHSLPTSDC
jgi:hypothetical protein